MIDTPQKVRTAGHLAALATVFVWGVTFISSKMLLTVINPIQLLLARMSIGYVFLWLLHPHMLHMKERKDWWLFVGAGAFGVFLYYFLENTSLVYSYASNVGVIVSIAPVFTVLVCSIAFHEKLKREYFIGSLVALLGLVLITFNGVENLSLNPLGDFLALLAASTWGFYSLFTKKLTEKGYAVIPATRRMFFCALVPMIIVNLLDKNPWPVSTLVTWPYLKHLLFLGLIGSGFCFISWNYSILAIGPITCSFYIYLCPVITVVCSAIFLDETITLLAMAGTAMTLVGLALSEMKRRKPVKA